MIAEQQQFLHLAKWVRQNSTHPLTRRLENDAIELRPRTSLSVLAIVSAVAPLVMGIMWVRETRIAADTVWMAALGLWNRRAIIDHQVLTVWIGRVGAGLLFSLASGANCTRRM